MSVKKLYEEINQSSKDINELFTMMTEASFNQDALEVYRLALLWCDKCRYRDALVIAAKEGKQS